jgi:hypothetical protein
MEERINHPVLPILRICQKFSRAKRPQGPFGIQAFPDERFRSKWLDKHSII